MVTHEKLSSLSHSVESSLEPLHISSPSAFQVFFPVVFLRRSALPGSLPDEKPGRDATITLSIHSGSVRTENKIQSGEPFCGILTLIEPIFIRSEL
jgi:hypothetical protein